MANYPADPVPAAGQNSSNLGNLQVKFFKTTETVNNNDTVAMDLDGAELAFPDGDLFENISGLSDQPIDAIAYADGILTVTADANWTNYSKTSWMVFCKK